MMREEVLASVARIGGRLGELRLDTDLDISHGMVRYLELLKLAALAQRPEGQDVAEALADINARLLAATTPLQREIFQTSALDETLLADALAGAGRAADAMRTVLAPAPVQSLRAKPPRSGPFLPRKGIGLALSASDVETYRGCPLRYKFARVLRIPTEQTQNQRFGIVVHQVLERYHSTSGETLSQLLELFEQAGAEAPSASASTSSSCTAKALAALRSYHERLHGQDSEPVWFERPFCLPARTPPPARPRRPRRPSRGPGTGGDEYELIDYKTSRPKTVAQLQDDIQLSLYALAARESWGLEASRQAYYYVLDDLKVPVPRDDGGRRGGQGHGARRRRGHPRSALRAHPVSRGLLDL